MNARPRCVFVDDDPDYLAMLRQIFPRICPEIEAIGFGSSVEALDFLRRVRVSFVLTDLRMPVLNGLQFAAAVRELNPAIPIILISGNEYGVDELTGVVDAVLWKGALISELAPTLDRLGIERSVPGLGWVGPREVEAPKS